jgi:hydrogenase maturation protein HypF
LAVSVRGVVQGVGFRPFVYREAVGRDLVGWVRNEAEGVRIEVQGPSGELDTFLDALRSRSPQSSIIAGIEVREVESRPEEGFRIRESEDGAAPRSALPADLATCADCLDEIGDTRARRHRYPFTNCTRCGPRFTIVEGLPYDRPRTSMQRFPMCADCAREYEDPSDRRFHAQPIACPVCGPRVELSTRDGRLLARDDRALREAAAALGEGRIVALKGIGGFQLLVDASNDAAVERLRRRKQRPDKPFALMLPSLQAASAHCRVSPEEADALTSTVAPIALLLRRHPDADRGPRSRIADAVAPGNSRLGVMLPYTPLHRILLEEAARPLVCTSGNLADEPLCIETKEARARLGGVADLFLTHDRPIVRPVDDSVVQADSQGIQVIRRARGYAPGALLWRAEGPPTLALGAHLKSTVALRLDDRIVPSQHLGDLSTAEGVAHFERAVEDLLRFYRVRPRLLVCDRHPDYASTRIAERLQAEWRIPLERVQHHHAHVESCRVDHGFEGEVLGLAWDGTGYGTDGTIWGGEVLVSEGPRFRRVGHLRPFPLPGGERAVQEPRRAALGLLWETGRDHLDAVERWFSPRELSTLLAMLDRRVNCPHTTSMGRLFDAVAALGGIRGLTSFEGQAAMELQHVLERAGADRLLADAGAYPLPLSDGTPAIADWAPLARAVLEDRSRGELPEVVSARFHNALAEYAVESARRAELPRVVLTGGCFQNAVLGARVRALLEADGFQVFSHRRVPANDGGISVGQLAAVSGR